MIGQKLFDKQEAAKELRVSISFLDHATAAKQIGHLKLGKKCYFTEADIEAFMAGRRVEPSPRKASTAAAAPGRRQRAAGSAA